MAIILKPSAHFCRIIMHNDFMLSICLQFHQYHAVSRNNIVIQLAPDPEVHATALKPDDPSLEDILEMAHSFEIAQAANKCLIPRPQVAAVQPPKPRNNHKVFVYQQHCDSSLSDVIGL